jgi:hypothetical protein
MNGLDRTRVKARAMLRAPVGLTVRLIERASGDFKYPLAVCAIFREEAPFLDEWIAFHHGIGVRHFYLYNNFSSDHFRQVLATWIARGLVTLIDWPQPVGQLSAYRDCIWRARRDCRWIAFLDLDEFLFSPQSTDIGDVLERYADLPGLEVWQVYFGSGGHEARPDLPVTEAYRMRAPTNRNSAKTIANPRMVYKVGVHRFKYWRGRALDTARLPVGPGREPVLDLLRINHYWSRSLQDLEQKVARHDASIADLRDRSWHFAFERTLNAERDETILSVARAVRQRR